MKPQLRRELGYLGTAEENISEIGIYASDCLGTRQEAQAAFRSDACTEYSTENPLGYICISSLFLNSGNFGTASLEDS